MLFIIVTIICIILIISTLIKSNFEEKEKMKKEIDNIQKIMEMKDKYVKNKR